jgi:GNAT superfamily N-acetyltransferase
VWPHGVMMKTGSTNSALNSMHASTIEIRPFDPDDLQALQEIRAAAFAPIFASFRDIVGEKIAKIAFAQAEAEQAQLLAGLCGPQSKEHVFVASRNGTVAGFISYSLDPQAKVGEIGLNAVHPDQAGFGIGTRLSLFAIAQMRVAGMRAAAVGTGGDDSHAPARRVYEKAGFSSCIPSTWMYQLL